MGGYSYSGANGLSFQAMMMIGQSSMLLGVAPLMWQRAESGSKQYAFPGGHADLYSVLSTVLITIEFGRRAV
jgi:hypothetical protein